MKLPKWAITVTPFSKTVALAMFVLLPYIGFWLGMNYQKNVDYFNQSINNQLLPTIQSLSPTPSEETANWETYSDSVYGFTFKYPSDWKIQAIPGKTVQLFSPEVTDIQYAPNGKGADLVINIPNSNYLLKPAKDYSGAYSGCANLKFLKSLMVNKYNVTEYMVSCMGANPGSLAVYIDNGTKVLDIEYDYVPKTNVTYSSIFDKILSSVTFL